MYRLSVIYHVLIYFITNHQHSLQNLCEVGATVHNLMYMSSYYKIKSGYKWVIISVKFVPEVYKDLISLLFVCLIWLASKSIQIIVNDVETRFSTIQDDAVHQVIEWKRNYFVTLDWIEEIDGFFGPVLVISFANIFLTTSFLSFRCLNGIFSGIDENLSASLFRIGKNITMMSGLICVTQMMKK